MGMTSNGSKKLLSEINVTPLVDVMLVLLIIFMVTAPMMTKGVAVKLPKTTAKSLPQKKNHIELTITQDEQLFLDGLPIDEATLKKHLSKMKRNGNLSMQILLRADKDVSYGKVVKIMALIKNLGIENLGLVTVPESVPAPTKVNLKKSKNEKG